MYVNKFSSNFTRIEVRIYVPQDLTHYRMLGDLYYNNVRMW